MNKSILAAAILLLLLGGGALAGMTVADNRIEALYSQDELGPLQNLTTSKADFGFMGGNVDWRADLVLDPCMPDAKVTLVGSDTISKGVTGYTIKSEMKPTFDDVEAMSIVDKLPALQAKTHVNWLGGGDIDFIFPAHELNNEGAVLSWGDMTGDVAFDKKGGEVFFEDLDFSIPLANFDYDSVTAKLSNVSYTSDATMGYVLESGTSKFAIEALEINDVGQDAHLSLADIAVGVEQNVNTDTVDVALLYEIGTVKGSGNGNVLAINDSIAHMNFNGISRPAVESLMEVLEDRSRECISDDVLADALEVSMLQALQAGMQVESLDNKVQIGDGSLTANAEMTMPAYPYSSLPDAMQTLPSQTTYDMAVEFDKAFVKNLGEMSADANPMLTGSVEDDWQTLIAMTGAEVQGDKAVIHKTN